MDLPKKWYDEELWPDFETAYLNGKVKHYFTFLKQLKSMPPSTIRNFVRRNKWVDRFKKLQDQVEANLAKLQTNDAQVQLYKDQRRATEMRTKVLDLIDDALEGKSEGKLDPRELKTIADTLHVVEADVRESQKSLEIKDGDAVIRVLITNKTAPFAHEYPSRGQVHPNGDDPVAGRSAERSSQGEDGLGGEGNMENRLWNEVAHPGGTGESVPGRSGVHEPVVQAGEKKHLGQVEQVLGGPTSKDQGGGELPGSRDQVDRREVDHPGGDGQLRRTPGDPSDSSVQRREGVLANSGIQ